MATTLVVRFPFGRYHATPWGRHVNEGQVELPPSPWRLLRAFYAVWKTRVPDLDEAVVHELLSALAAPPSFFVPPSTLSHTRHYYPDSTSRTAALSVDRTLDAFAVMGRDAELAIRWHATLSSRQHVALEKLAVALPYLGRADSICEARLGDDWHPTPWHAMYCPVDVDESVPLKVKAVSLLSPTLPLDVEALTLRPVDVRGKNLLFPGSTRFVGYSRTEPDATPTRTRRKPASTPVEALRFSILERVRPPFAEALLVTDRLRNAALSKLGTLRGSTDDSNLAGRHADHTRMLDQHGHAHYLALSDPERRLAELVVWAPSGLDPDEFKALSLIRTLTAPEGVPGPGELAVRVVAYGGTRDVLADLEGKASGSTRWESVTPFVPSRHFKPRKQEWEQFLAAELGRELEHRSIRVAFEVSILPEGWRAFARYRPSKRFAKASRSFPSAPPGAMLAVTFEAPVRGPLALGHLSHFGLGLFQPMT